MKNIGKVLGSAAVMCTLSACGGSTGDNAESQNAEQQIASLTGGSDVSVTSVSLVNEDGSQSESVSLTGVANSAAANELVIQNAIVVENNAATNGSSHSVEYQFEVVDSGGAAIDLDALSVALEIAASGRFSDSYRQSLFDIRVLENSASDSGTLSVSARGAATGLPGGIYSARLVVNPNWQNAFDIVPEDRDQSQPYHFIEERDYANNASNTFSVSVPATIACSEDEFEENDSLSTATVIPVGGQITASLCTDSVDFFSLELADGENTSIFFDYVNTAENANQASKYILLDSEFNTIGGSVARESNDIRVSATSAGTYYLGVYGQRSTYQLTREPNLGKVLPNNFSNDFVNSEIFTSESVAGPQSWLLGDITLNKLAFTESGLEGQVIDCSRITTQFSEDVPVAYVTPLHFADTYNFRFLEDGDYLVDGGQHSGWSVQSGDIVNDFWYKHDYPGFAENTGEHSWRYWSADGLSYVECAIEVN